MPCDGVAGLTSMYRHFGAEAVCVAEGAELGVLQ